MGSGCCKRVNVGGVPMFISVGPEPIKFRLNGRTILVEDHPRYGPVWMDKNGQSSKRQPSDNSAFWDVYEAWCAAGKPIDEFRRAVAGDIGGRRERETP